MLANQASSMPPTTVAFSDQMMQDGAGRLWSSLGQGPGLQMAWRRLPAFRSDMERQSRPYTRSKCGLEGLRREPAKIHGMSPSGPARRKSHGKIVLRVAQTRRQHELQPDWGKLHLGCIAAE